MKKILVIAFLVSSLTAYAQSAGQIISAFAPILDETNTTEVTQIPLPPGEWVVMRSAIRVTNEAAPKIRDLSLLRIESSQVVGAIGISVQINTGTVQKEYDLCRPLATNTKNFFDSIFRSQTCLAVDYGSFLQNDNPATKSTRENLERRNVSHDYNGFRITYFRHQDLAKYFMYQQFIFPSSFGLENPRVNSLTASPYHPDLIKNHPEKYVFASSVTRYARQIMPLLDQAYFYGSKSSLPAFIYVNDRLAIKGNPSPGAIPPPQNSKNNEGNLLRNGYGTGFYVNKLGDLVTNYHVVRDAQNIVVLNHDKTVSQAKLIASDILNDLAIIRAEKPASNYLQILRSEDTKRGEKVFTLGFPNPNVQGRSIKYTDGTISATTGILDQPTKFQISVPIQPGNSGGPLIDIDGNVIGVVVAKLSAEAALKSSGSLPENINYAVKSNYLIELLRSSQTPFTLGKATTGIARNSADIAASAEKAVVLIGVQTNQVR